MTQNRRKGKVVGRVREEERQGGGEGEGGGKARWWGG